MALMLISSGIIMIRDNLVAYGINSRTLSPSGFGGTLLILVGCILLLVAYFSLSPFGKIRTFLEGGNRKKKKTTREKQEK